MILQQISIFLENRPGTLASVVAALADDRINLRALSVAETERFGILRIIADDTDAAMECLREMGITAKVSEVVGVEVPDRPGGLADLLSVFADSDVSIKYMYAEVQGRGSNALLIMKLDPLDEALERLAAAGLAGEHAWTH